MHDIFGYLNGCSFYFLCENFPHKNLNLALKLPLSFLLRFAMILRIIIYHIFSITYVEYGIFSNDILFVCCAFFC